MLETWSLFGRFGSPENPVIIGLEASGIIGNRSWFISTLELQGELEASRSSLGTGLGASLLSPVKLKHLVESSPSASPSPPSGERSCWGELPITGDPTVRFSLEVKEEDKLSDLGSKTLKGKAPSDLSIPRAACLVVGVDSEDEVGPSSVKISRGMPDENIPEQYHFIPTKVKGADNICRKQAGRDVKGFIF